MLNRLPVDVLDQITQKLLGRDINKVWLLGDALLHAKMSAGGVTKYHDAWNSLSTEPAWPTSVLSHLHRLVSFDIQVWFRYSLVGVIGLNLSVLPPTLTHLGFRKANFCLLSHLQSLSSNSDIVPFDRRFPSLKTLNTSGHPNILQTIPETLVKISIDSREYPRFDLSPHITDLRINFHFTTKTDKLPPLPRSLTSLRLDSKLWNLRSILPFPSGLRSLYLHDVDSNDWVKDLPSELTTLCLEISMRAVFAEDIAFLPRSLTTLLLRGQYWGDSKLNDTNVADLPPGLTELDVSSECTKLSGFPETLTKLNLRGSIEAVGGVNALPKSLLHLKLSSIDSLTNAAIPQLPPKLVTLNLPQAVRISSVVGIPPTITFLKLYNISDAEASILPPTLKGLILDNENQRTMAPRLTASGIALLPDSIEFLKLSVSILDEDTLPQPCNSRFKWPSALRSLTLSHLSSIADSAIALLPATVSSLVIPGRGPTGACFASLPKNLVELVVLSAMPLSAEDLKNLPRTIALLEIWCKPMTDAWVPNLPRLISAIHLHRTAVTDAAVRSHLRYIDIVQLFESTELRS